MIQKGLSRADFGELGKERIRFHGTLFSLSVYERPARYAQFTCVVSKKVASKATKRNVVKRRCRQAARAHMEKLALAPVALVFRAKQKAAGAHYTEVDHDIAKLLGRVSLG